MTQENLNLDPMDPDNRWAILKPNYFSDSEYNVSTDPPGKERGIASQKFYAADNHLYTFGNVSKPVDTVTSDSCNTCNLTTRNNSINSSSNNSLLSKLPTVRTYNMSVAEIISACAISVLAIVAVYELTKK